MEVSGALRYIKISIQLCPLKVFLDLEKISRKFCHFGDVDHNVFIRCYHFFIGFMRRVIFKVEYIFKPKKKKHEKCSLISLFHVTKRNRSIDHILEQLFEKVLVKQYELIVLFISTSTLTRQDVKGWWKTASLELLWHTIPRKRMFAGSHPTTGQSCRKEPGRVEQRPCPAHPLDPLSRHHIPKSKSEESKNGWTFYGNRMSSFSHFIV